MDDLITGLVGVALIGLFLGFYAFGIGAIPFGVIVVAVLLMLVAEFVEGIRKGKNGTKE